MSKPINFETAKMLQAIGIANHFRPTDLAIRSNPGFYEYAQYDVKGNLLIRSWQDTYPAPTKSELSDWLRENHKMFLSITPVVITSLDDVSFKGTIFYFKDCWRLAPALNSTDYDKLYDDLLYKALTLIKSV